MRVDIVPPEKWEELSENLRENLSQWFSFDKKISIFPYKSLSHSIFEICEGSSNFFGHKRSFGLVKGSSPVFSPLLAGFYKDGYKVQLWHADELAQAKTWVESLSKDTNFVLFSSDHAVTGELTEWEELDTFLNERKIFSLRISHSDWLRSYQKKDLSPKPYSAHIFSVGPDLSIAICGEKIKNPPVVASTLTWRAELVLSEMQNRVGYFHEEESVIKRFESELPKNWQPWRQGARDSSKRLFDRSLIYNTQIHGGAVLDALIKQFPISLVQKQENPFIETTNLSRWNSLTGFFDWWEPEVNADILRGMLIVDLALVKNPQFKTWLQKAEQEIQI